MTKPLKIIYIIIAIVFAVLVIIFGYFSFGLAPEVKNMTWGVDFSQMQAENLKLNWKEAYLAILDDLGVKNIKLHTQWDFVEGKNNDYYFSDIDWQLAEAGKRNAKIIYVVGIKTGRWPECHIPNWAEKLNKADQQKEALKYIKEVVQKYKDNNTIEYWQVENEPFFRFGECPSWYYSDTNFLKKEIELVKSIDNTRSVIVSDSGDLSFWIRAAKDSDIVGITMYKQIWINIADIFGFRFNYVFSPINYWRKVELINKIFGKKVICVELQTEPWLSKPFNNASLQEQEKSMNLSKFKENINFAKQTGIDKFYLWGVEWWYWMKTKQNSPEIWGEAKNLF